MKPQIENLGKVSITVEKDPYDASKAYPKLTIVYIEGDYRTYISRKPVLPNTSILDKEFWIPFSSLSEQLLINYNGFKALVLEDLASQNNKIDTTNRVLNQFINSDITALIESALQNLAVVIDSNYVHTDNNYTTAEKNKLGALPTNSDLNTLLENITNRFADYYTKLQTYNQTEIDNKVQAVRNALDTLIGTNDVTTAIDTFNEIKSFLADYSNNGGDLKDIIDALETAVKTWTTNNFVEQANLYNNIYNKTEVYTKSEIDGKVQTINNTFGSYLLSTDAASIYLSKTDAANQYQPKGSYLVAADIAGKADKSELTITPGTGNNSDKTTIQLKNNVSATVLTEHQDISGKANTSDLHTVATSGSYTDLNDKPTLFSGDYNDLTNKPTIPKGYGDDAARANWGGDWRMPTTAEFQALGAAVNTAWTEDYQGSGVNGLLCTDKTDSSKTLFFPAAGYCDSGSVYSVGDGGDYWSSSLNFYSVVSAWNLDFNDEDTDWDNGSGRCCGYAVRGVLDGSNVNANGHEYVEIGGLKWATMNVGANSITDYGLYFQWGDTQGYTASQVGSVEGQKYFYWSDYKYGNGTSSSMSKDMTKYNATDGKTVLELPAPVEYLHKVAVTGDYNDLSNIPNIAQLAKQIYLTYITSYPEDCYFTYIALGNGTCHLENSDYYYSKDLGATWNHITSSTLGIHIVKGDVVLFKGTIMPQAYAGVGIFKSNVAYEIAGNPMSFIYGDDFRGKIDWPSNMPAISGFISMFYGETNLRSAKHLILIASSVPYMAYGSMFHSCSNLVAGPIIAAETLSDNSCSNMFYDCAKLSYINTRFQTTSGNNSLSYWVYNVASKGIFIKNVNATWTYTGDSGVPDGWTVYYDYQH